MKPLSEGQASSCAASSPASLPFSVANAPPVKPADRPEVPAPASNPVMPATRATGRRRVIDTAAPAGTVPAIMASNTTLLRRRCGGRCHGAARVGVTRQEFERLPADDPHKLPPEVQRELDGLATFQRALRESGLS